MACFEACSNEEEVLCEAAMIVWVLLLLAGTLGIAAAPAAIVLQKNVKQVITINNKELAVFCYEGEKSWSRVWSSLEFIVYSKAEEFKLDVNDNASVLEEQFNSWWSLWPLWSSDSDAYQKNIMIAPYGKSCVGLSYHGSSAPLTITVGLKEHVVSWKFPFLLIIGVTLLLSSRRLSRSVNFHYTSGVAIGIIASVLILVYIVSKLVPGKPVAYSVMFGGWALVAWAMTEMKSQFLHLVTSYPLYIIVYVIVVGMASLLFCHWRGPITHVRTFQVIQWSIQLVAMTLIYHATNFRETSVILLVIIILFYLIHNKLSQWIKSFYFHHVLLRWYVMFPPKHKMLTVAEYKKEGVRETALALKQLRDFCRQNTGEMYTIMAKLQSPNRFSKFLDGDFHLTDHEVQEYHQSSSHDSDIDDEI